MEIKHISAKPYSIGLKKPFSYHTLTLTTLPYTLITTQTDESIQGNGEAALAWDVTGETQAGSIEAVTLVRDVIEDKKLNSVQDVQSILSDLESELYGNTGIKTAIESALLDALGKKVNKPIFELLGGKKKDSVTTIKTLSFEDQESSGLIDSIADALSKNVPYIKLKVGGDENAEKETIATIASAFPDIKLIFDANQAWNTPKEALGFISKINPENIAWLEQPFSAHNFEAFAALKKELPVSLMADESCHTLFDLKNLHRVCAIDMINIKLAKTGGLLETKRMIEYCKNNSIQYVLGDMIHSSIGTAYNLHAATLGDFMCYDLTRPDRIDSNMSKGLVYHDFDIEIPTGFGLGVPA
ncbi:hypothetical protein KKH43_00450 [Patescibacteria group bacterium]|nr:hypothetical protein [Patescibacteria group bacterium]